MSGPAELSLAQLDYPCSDVERTVAFFVETLGRPLLLHAGPLAFVDLAPVRLYLRPAKDAQDLRCASILYLKTVSLQATIDEVTARGALLREAAHVIAEMPDHVLWMAFIADPDGRLVGLMEERPR